MFKFISPEIAIVGGALLALFVFGILIIWHSVGDSEDVGDSEPLDTAASLAIPHPAVALA